MKHLACCVVTLLASASFAADWPQYRGANSDGTSPETNILKSWPQEGPRVVWKAPIGESFGSFAVSQGKAFAFFERGGNEVCVALDAATGKELWATPIDKTIFERQGGNGPRSTPTVDPGSAGGRVYVLGTYLKLACLNAADGKVVWQHDIQAAFDGQNGTSGINKWGSASSPVVEGDLVLVAGGGEGQSLLAFNKTTGALAWKKHTEKITHATPTPATLHGVRQVIFFTQSGLVSVEPKSGDVLWRFAFPWQTSTASSPIVYQDMVYCSAAYNVGAGACKVEKTATGWKATQLWRTPSELMNHWTTPVCKDGYIYGIFGTARDGAAPLKCIEMATGKEMWSKPGFGGGGATTLVDGHVLVQGDKGPLVLVEATPKAYNEVARAQPLGGKCWTMAVVANGRIYARNTKEGICLDVTGGGAQ